MIIRFGRVEWRKKLWLERRKETKRPRERGEEKELEVKRKSRIDGSEGSRCIFERVDEWKDEYSGGVKRRKETEKKKTGVEASGSCWCVYKKWITGRLINGGMKSRADTEGTVKKEEGKLEVRHEAE